MTMRFAPLGTPTVNPADPPSLLGSSIRAAVEESDAERDIPAKLLAELCDAGAFRQASGEIHSSRAAFSAGTTPFPLGKSTRRGMR
jgi:hypothetical protein